MIKLEEGQEIPEGASISIIGGETFYTTEGEAAEIATALAAIDAHNTRTEAKRERTEAVKRITVTTAAGNEFDGDEKSQDRMARAIIGMTESDLITWVLSNNTPIQVTRVELQEALRLAGEAQTAIWVIE